MSEEKTVARLFELAIAAEKAAEELYQGLEAKFAHQQEVAAFWREYAAEETTHARWLERLREGQSPQRLSERADPTVLQKAHKALDFSVENALEGIENLEEAYQLAHEVESSETNAIFEFLIVNFSSDKKTHAFLRSQLKDHIGKLMTEFPIHFRDAGARRRVEALSDI